MSSSTSQDRSEIVFFDLETTIQSCTGQTRRHLLEFWAILVCPLTLRELGEPYTTLIRPSDLSAVPVASGRSNGITRDMVASARQFWEVADEVYEILNGRVWAGHNIVEFDWVLIHEAFAEIGRPAPVPKGTIDTLILLRERFGTRAGDLKMATLATHFGLGEQPHRSLGDVRMNLEVVKYCSAVLFLEEGFRGYAEFLDPDEVLIPSLRAPSCHSFSGERVQLMHRDAPLQLHCAKLRLCYGVNDNYYRDGRPLRTIGVYASSSLCQVLNVCDNLAKNTYVDSGGSSTIWKPVVKRKKDFTNSQFIRLNIPYSKADIPYSKADMASENNSVYTTEIQHFRGTSQRPLNRFDASQLDSLFQPGASIDTFFSLEVYDFHEQQSAGIRLVAKKLIIYSK